MIPIVINDLDLLELHLWLADLIGGRVVEKYLKSTIGSVQKSESELRIVISFSDRDEVVIVVELLNGWEMCVLILLDWPVGIRVSPKQFVGILVL